ncbi:MAG: hypothetical protein IT427_17140 [Pirellulales bacterium]|nr:hypothetical protein [Pirellulales bacterium]
MNRFIGLATLAVVVASLAVVDLAHAQRGAESKAAGQYNFYGKSSSRSMRGAREYSQDYRQYAQSTEKVDQELAQEVSDAIGTYIVKAQKHMAWMRKNAIGNQETLASLDVIDKNLADAAKHHKEMHDCCAGPEVDKTTSIRCCEGIDRSLAMAIADHDKLMKRLGFPNPTPTKK